MTQRQLDRAVASATGETVAEVRRLGFSLLASPETELDPEPMANPNVIDWDDHYLVELPRRHHRPQRMAA